MTLSDATRCLILFYAITNVDGRNAHGQSTSCSADSDSATTADRSLLHQRRWLFWGDSSEKDSNSSEKDSKGESSEKDSKDGNGKVDKYDQNYNVDADNPMDEAAAKNLTDYEALSGTKQEATKSSEGKLNEFDRNYTSDAHNPMDDAAAKGLTDNEALSGKNHEAADSSEKPEAKEASPKEEPTAATSAPAPTPATEAPAAATPVPPSPPAHEAAPPAPPAHEAAALVAKVASAIIQAPPVAATPENETEQSHNDGKFDSFDRDYLLDADNPMDAVAGKGLTDNEALSGKNRSSGKPGDNEASPKEKPPAGTSAPAANDAPANTQAPAPAPATKAPAATAPSPPEASATDEAPSATTAAASAETTTTLGHTVPLCGTRNDPSVSKTSLYYSAAPEGTPCVFGVDDRDEGAHCIMDDIKFGTFGWCWTNVPMDTWGSCNASCPLFGPLKVLEDKIDHLRQSLAGPASEAPAPATKAPAAAPSNATA